VKIQPSLQSLQQCYLYCYDDIRKKYPLPSKKLTGERNAFSAWILHEGIDALTKQLPSIGKQLPQIVEGNDYTFANYTGKKKTVYGIGNIPVLFSDLLIPLIEIRQSVPSTYIAEIFADLTQFFLLFYKLELPVEDESSHVVYYKAVQDELAEHASKRKHIYKTSPARIAQSVIGDLLPRKRFTYDKLIPKPGPGATADHLKQWEKNKPTAYYQQLARVFKYEEFFSTLPFGLCNPHELPVKEPCSRGIFVPKDSRGPRLISAEPAEYMMCQQALMGYMVGTIEERSENVNFLDQSINQRLVSEASQDQQLATVDMKEASDRVTVDLAEHIIRKTNPELWIALAASRTGVTKFGDITVQNASFGPMGSATTFPVEALVFYALCVEALVRQGCDYSIALKSVYVYGDDIIIPVKYMDFALDFLERYDLVVNRQKSFSKGFFRESCGMDMYFGCVTTPLYIRQLPKHSNQSTLAYSNTLWKKGFWLTATYLHRRDAVGTSDGQRFTFMDANPRTRPSDYRWNPILQRFEYRIYVSTSNKKAAPDDLGSLFAVLNGYRIGGTTLGNQPGSTMYDVRNTSKNKTSWVAFKPEKRYANES